MAKIVANNGVTVELSGREVALIRQALQFSVANNAAWSSRDDREADGIDHVLAGGDE